MKLVVMCEKHACGCSGSEYNEFDALLKSRRKFKVGDLKNDYYTFKNINTVTNYLNKDNNNLTKLGLVRKSSIWKEMKKRNISFADFLVQEKGFKRVEYKHVVIEDYM